MNNDKPMTHHDLQLASLKMLASVHMITGETDIGETIRWAVERIEQLEERCGQLAGQQGNSGHGVIVPFRRSSSS